MPRNQILTTAFSVTNFEMSMRPKNPASGGFRSQNKCRASSFRHYENRVLGIKFFFSALWALVGLTR